MNFIVFIVKISNTENNFHKNIKMSANKEQVKQVRIKTGVLKRSQKDHIYYTKEEKKLKERLLKMQSEGKDQYDIKYMQD